MWTPLNPEDVLSLLGQSERTLFGTGDSAGSSDRLDTIIQGVVSLVRGKVAAWPENRNVMGANLTIPDELYSDALEIARYKLLTALPSTANSFITEARMEGYRSAQKHLDDAANGKLVIEPAPSATETGTTFDSSSIAYGSKGHREEWNFFGGGRSDGYYD